MNVAKKGVTMEENALVIPNDISYKWYCAWSSGKVPYLVTYGLSEEMMPEVPIVFDMSSQCMFQVEGLRLADMSSPFAKVVEGIPGSEVPLVPMKKEEIRRKLKANDLRFPTNTEVTQYNAREIV